MVCAAVVEEVVAHVGVFPLVRSTVCGITPPGDVPSSVPGLPPWRKRLEPAALAIGALIAPIPSPARARPSAAATTHPSRDPRPRFPGAATTFSGWLVRREDGRGPRSHR